MDPSYNIKPGQWLRNSIVERYPGLEQGEADLNHDGSISNNEIFEGDPNIIEDVVTYYTRNKHIIDQNVPLARWASRMDRGNFDVYNPLFDYLYLSLKTVPHDDVRRTIALAKDIIADYRVLGNPHASTEKMTGGVYRYLHDEGIAVGGTALMSDGLARGRMGRNAAAIFVMGVAYQLGHNVYSVPHPVADETDDPFCQLVGISPCPLYAPFNSSLPGHATFRHADGTIAELGLARFFGSLYTAHARAEMQFGGPAAARRLYRNAIAIDPDNVSLKYRFGSMLRKMGRFDEAIAFYTEMLVRNPGALDARINRGLARLEKKDFAGAVEEFRDIIKVHSDNARVHLHLARALNLQDKRGMAIAACNEAIAIDPRYGAAYLQLGRMMHEKGKRRKALNLYRKAYRLDGSLSDALYFQGVVYREWGNRGAGRHYFLKAINNDRRNAKAMYFNALGLYEQRRKNYTQAERYFTRATKRDPRYARGFANRADVRNFYLRKYFAARKDYERALAISPNLMYARVNLGFLLLHLKEPEQALIHSSKAVTIAPKNCDAHFLHGQVLFEHHKNKITSFEKPLLASLASFEKAVTCSGKRVNVEYLLWRGKAWFAKGNIAEALRDLDKAVELDPKYAEAYLLRSEVKKAKRDDWGAARDRTEGCTLKPALCPTQLPSRTLPPSSN